MNNAWTNEELEILKREYPLNGSNIPILLEKHSKIQIARKANACGLSLRKKTSDHLGNTYPSIKALCDKYQITIYAYYQRRYDGWSLEKTLTTSTTKIKNRIGEKRINAFDGTLMEIIDQKTESNHKSKYLILCNNTTKVWRKYEAFKTGIIKYRPKRDLTTSSVVGKKITNTQGLEMKIINAYRESDDLNKLYVDILFPFKNAIKYHVLYNSEKWNKGQISHPQYPRANKNIISLLGHTDISYCGLRYYIKDYIENKDRQRYGFLIEYEDGESTWVSTGNYKAGRFKHPYLAYSNKNKKGVYKNFEYSCKFKNGYKTYYRCRCLKCGFEHILTPQKMMKHICEKDDNE